MTSHTGGLPGLIGKPGVKPPILLISALETLELTGQMGSSRILQIEHRAYTERVMDTFAFARVDGANDMPAITKT